MKIVRHRIVSYIYISTDMGQYRIDKEDKRFLEEYNESNSNWQLVQMGLDISSYDYKVIMDYVKTIK